MSDSALTLTPYTLEETFRVLHLLQRPERRFVQIDWQPLPRWLLRPDVCGVIGWQAGEPVGLLVAGAPRAGAAWLRVAAVSGQGLAAGGGYTSRLRQMWEGLVPRLREAGVERVLVLPVDAWLQRSLAPLGFTEVDRILAMRHMPRELLPPDPGRVGFELRAATSPDLDAVDLDAVLAIDGAAFGPLWRMDRVDLDAAVADGGRLILAEDGGRIAGFQLTYVLEGGVHLARLAVLPDSQGQGIGSALLRAELAASEGQGAITLNVLGSSDTAQRLYIRHGFDFTGNEVPLWALDLA